ncbi:hypothetical protein EUX98_g2854 [Antrodiella citrinella]|uniref:Uncharacterized protein n=1 Tax=Antrodiella citrinella TaxID=2447956 RepID=A0A4S4MXZ3_9APHY|nr:hypothetical protein EUX98_g2854 [Antrodiella citrinella]
MPAPYVPPERSPPRSRSPDASHIQPAMPPSPVSQVASSPAENASRMPPSAVENVSSYRHDAPWSSTLQSPDTAPIVPAGAQKTPLMLALESPRSYHSPIRGPKRPTRLTKPPILAQSAPVRDTPPSLAPTSSPLLPPTPESQTSSPIEQDLVQNNLPAPSASKTSRTGGLFAALRRPRRRSAENGQNIVPTARNEPPIIQVVKELTIERIPGPPIIQVDEETKQIMQGVEGTVSQIVEYENWNGDQLTGIRTQVDTVLHELRHMPKPISRIIQPPSPAVSMPPPIDVAQITDRLDEMGTTLNVNLPELFGKVEELMKQAAALQKARAVVVMKDVAAVPGEVTAVPPPEDKTKTTDPIPETLQSEQTEFEHKDEEGNDEVVGGPGESETVAPDESQVGDDSAPAEGETIKMELFDPTQLENKLDVLLALCQQLQNDAQSQPAPMAIASTEDGETQEVLSPESIEKPNSEAALRNAEEFLELLKMDLDQRASQTDQQTDSVRYLHELNSWLEAFVNHGTSQIDNVLAGVQHLCKELGPIPELQVMQNVSHGEGRGPSQESSNLLSDIRRLLVTSQEREGNTLALEASVNGLVAAVHEELRRGAESRNTLTTESIVGLIERHRQDQERLLRNVASDLSNDIRGERLRFVEAMKEATAINVQIHVEEFKKELTREVLLMTQEVGRLQKERQTLEQQIADLFSFYAKQKQSNNRSSEGPPTQTPSVYAKTSVTNAFPQAAFRYGL